MLFGQFYKLSNIPKHNFPPSISMLLLLAQARMHAHFLKTAKRKRHLLSSCAFFSLLIYNSCNLGNIRELLHLFNDGVIEILVHFDSHQGHLSGFFARYFHMADIDFMC